MTDDKATPAGGTAPEAGAAQAPARQRRRALLVAGMVGAAVLLLAVVAALVVPGVVTDRRAQAAADAFAAERDQWRETFTSEALAPYVDFEAAEYEDYVVAITATREATDIAWDAPSAVPDATELEAACSTIADLAGHLAAFDDASAPRLEQIDGGQRNADYASAQQLYEQERLRYEASDAFVAEAEAAFADIDEACGFFIAQNAVDRALAEAQNGYVAAYTMAHEERVLIGTEQLAGETLEHYLVCTSETGCVPFDDMDARAAAGDLWDAASDTRHLGMVSEVLETRCPDSLQEACAARRDVELTLHELAGAIGDAYRSEDPVAIALATDDGDPVMPQLNDAYAEYNEVWIAQFDALAERTEELTGHTSLPVAVDELAADAAQRIGVAAVAASEG